MWEIVGVFFNNLEWAWYQEFGFILGCIVVATLGTWLAFHHWTFLSLVPLGATGGMLWCGWQVYKVSPRLSESQLGVADLIPILYFFVVLLGGVAFYAGFKKKEKGVE